MKRTLTAAVAICAIAALFVTFGCNPGSDEVVKLKKEITDRETTIKQMRTEAGLKEDALKQCRTELELLRQAGPPSAQAGARKVAWEEILRNSKKMLKDDGKYACLYAVLEKTDKDSAVAATRALEDKGYRVEPAPWDGVIRVSSPQEVRTELVMFKKVNMVQNTRSLGDAELKEVAETDGVKSVWPQSVLYFPATFSANAGPKSLFIDVKVIALPSEFFEEEKDRIDLAEFDRYDGGGAQVILPRVLVKYYNRFFRYSEGWNLEYEKNLNGQFFYLQLASSALLGIEAKPVKPIDLKAVGFTDRVTDLTIIVKPEVVDDWNKRMFDKKE